MSRQVLPYYTDAALYHVRTPINLCKFFPEKKIAISLRFSFQLLPCQKSHEHYQETEKKQAEGVNELVAYKDSPFYELSLFIKNLT